MSSTDDTPGTQAPETPSRMRSLMASNAFRAGIVVLAAAIIFGAWAFAEWRGDEQQDDPALVVTLDDEVERARLAAERGDVDEAIEILERVLAEDPDNERAAALLRQLRRDQAAVADPANGNGQADGDNEQPGATPSQPGQDPSQPGGDSAAGRPIDDSVLLAPVSDLGSLLPQVISGWQRGMVVADSGSATVPFSPATMDGISRALYTVHDRGSVDGALTFIEDTSKIAYADNAASVRIGREDGYFGTSGAHVATAVFARGRFAFELLVTTRDGDPAGAKDAAIRLAQEFEASR